MSAPPPPPGKNVVHQLVVTLEDLYNGATRKLAVQKNAICEKCEGEAPLLCGGDVTVVVLSTAPERLLLRIRMR